MRRLMNLLAIVALIAVALSTAGCAAAPAPAATGGVSSATPSNPAASAAAAASSAVSSTPAGSPSVHAQPSASASPTAAPVPSSAPHGSVVLAYEENAQVELISGSGRRVLIDVWDPDRLSRPPTPDDILLTTHFHEDHYSSTFVDAFPGRKLTFTPGRISVDGISITGIMGKHGVDEFSIDNELFVVRVAGLTIAHLGDLGQKSLSPAQLKAIGRADVLISQLENPIADVTLANHKGFDYVKRLQPKIFIPTHIMEDTPAVVKRAATTWPTVYAPNRFVTIGPDMLPDTTTVLFMGDEAWAYGKIAKANATSW